KDVGDYIEEAIEGRFNTLAHDKSTLEIVRGKEEEVTAHAISAVIANGDPIGAVLAVAKDDQSISEVEHKVIETAANLLGKQIEEYYMIKIRQSNLAVCQIVLVSKINLLSFRVSM